MLPLLQRRSTWRIISSLTRSLQYVHPLTSNDPVRLLPKFLYAPQMVLSLLTATAYGYRPDSIRNAIIIQVISWIAQFIGHGVAEGRAPALLDNIVGGRCRYHHFHTLLSACSTCVGAILRPFGALVQDGLPAGVAEAAEERHRHGNRQNT